MADFEKPHSKIDIRSLFTDWVEPDVSCYYMACLLGMLIYSDDQAEWRNVKGIFNTNNPISTATFHLLECLVSEGLLESNEDTQYRWNRDYEKHLRWDKDWWGIATSSA